MSQGLWPLLEGRKSKEIDSLLESAEKYQPH